MVDMEISDSEGCYTTPDSFAATQKTTYKSDNLHAGSVLKMPSAEKNLSPKCSENDWNANLSPDTTVQSIKKTTPKTEDTAAACLTHSVFKSKSELTTSSSGTTITNTTHTAKPSAESVRLKHRSGSASEVTAASGSAAQVRCRTSSKGDDGPRCAEATAKASAASQIKVLSVASAKTLERGDPDASAKMSHERKSVGESGNIENHKKNKPEHNPPRKEPCLSSSKAPSENLMKVGTNQLIVVTCENKKQVYCLLCSDKLNMSSQYHLTKFDHQLKYVKMKYPEWTAKESELKSKLSHTVALLAKIEKDLPYTRLPQTLEVNKDVYENLGILSEKKAVERVKAMLGQIDLQISSFPVADSLGASRQEVFSLCEVSSSDDGRLISLDDQPEQEDRTRDQTTWNQMSELESDMKEDIKLGTNHQNLDGEVIEIDDESDAESSQSCSFYTEDVEESAQLEPDATVWCPLEVQPPTERLGRTVQNKEAPRVSTKTQPDQGNKTIHQTQQFQITEMEEYLENEENSSTAQIQDQLDPDLILSHPVETITGVKVVETLIFTEHPLTPETQQGKTESTPQKPSPVQTCSPQLQTAASLGQQNSSGLSHQVLQALTYCSRPGEHGSSQAQPRISFEERAQSNSNLYHYMKAYFGKNNPAKLILGQDFVWECQSIHNKTFYLCEVCEMKIPLGNICDHMTSIDHHLHFLTKEHLCLLDFWWKEDLPIEKKKELYYNVIQMTAERELASQLDVQCLLLSPEMHRFLQTAQFDEALRIVKSLKGKSGDFSRLFCASQQNTGQRTEKSSLEKKARVGEDLSVVGERRVLSLEVNPSCCKDEPVVSSVPVVGTDHVPQEDCRGLFPQPNVSKIQNYDPQLQEKSVSEESTSPSTNISTICQKPKVSPSNEVRPIRKRAAETPPETLLQSLEQPLPVKRSPSPANVQNEPKPPSAPEFTSVNSTEKPTPHTLKDEDSGPKQVEPTVNRKLFAGLVSMMKESKFKIIPTPLMAACDDTESSSPSKNVEHKDLKSETTETKAPQMPQSSSAEDAFRKAKSFSADCAPTSQEQDQILQSRSELNRFCQQTISTIITTRSNPVKNTFQDGKMRETRTDVSRDHQISFHTDSTANLTDSVAVPAVFYAPHNQVFYDTRGDSGSLFAQAVAGCPTQNDPHVIAASSRQGYLYSNQTYPDQMENPFSLQMVRQSSAAQVPPGWNNQGLQQIQYCHFWTSGSRKTQ